MMEVVRREEGQFWSVLHQLQQRLSYTDRHKDQLASWGDSHNPTELATEPVWQLWKLPCLFWWEYWSNNVYTRHISVQPKPDISHCQHILPQKRATDTAEDNTEWAWSSQECARSWCWWSHPSKRPQSSPVPAFFAAREFPWTLPKHPAQGPWWGGWSWDRAWSGNSTVRHSCLLVEGGGRWRVRVERGRRRWGRMEGRDVMVGGEGDERSTVRWWNMHV